MGTKMDQHIGVEKNERTEIRNDFGAYLILFL